MIIGMRGYCGIGIVGGKTPENLGMLWRSAHTLGASFIFTAGARYKEHPTDTMKSTRHVPLFEYEELGQLSRPRGSELVAVEKTEDFEEIPSLVGFRHPQRAVYVLGAEDDGLSTEALALCDHLVQIPSTSSLNVAVAGSIVLYDRLAKA
jgi:tRNA G18 (ribose-2'-O)-methylase SpoU